MNTLKLEVMDAEERFKFWVSCNAPFEAALTESEFKRKYQARFCIDIGLYYHKDYESFLRQEGIIFCPRCLEKPKNGIVIKQTRLYISVIDDPMTTFKALARFFCHSCEFEEYHPLKQDPRKFLERESAFSNIRAQYRAVPDNPRDTYGGESHRLYTEYKKRLLSDSPVPFSRDEYKAFQRLVQRYK